MRPTSWKPASLVILHDFLDVAVLEALVGLDDELGRRVALVELVENVLELRLRTSFFGSSR